MRKELLALISRFTNKRILVIGDLCIDEYVVGKAQRLSREAPVPVLEFTNRFTLPGEAANPSLNVRALQGLALMVGTVGDDEAGRALRNDLEARGIDTSGVVVHRGGLTTQKTRVLAEVSLHFPQQIVRVDRVAQQSLPATVRRRLLDHLTAAIPEVDAILLSDYKNGVVCPEVIELVRELATRHSKIATVDSQGDLFRFRGYAVVKSNQEEAAAALRTRLEGNKDFGEAGRQLLKELGSAAVLITRGSDGMTLVERGRAALHLPATNRSEVFDVTGAGDTVIAVLTLALAAGGTLVQAVHLANIAAGLVVRKLGNATATPAELVSAVQAAEL